jgi:ABC-type proline/glycine betaine transport system substrate-binding protein
LTSRGLQPSKTDVPCGQIQTGFQALPNRRPPNKYINTFRFAVSPIVNTSAYQKKNDDVMTLIEKSQRKNQTKNQSLKTAYKKPQ